MSLTPDVLAWAATAVAAGAQVAGAVELPQARGSGPWRLDVETGGAPARVVLHLGDAGDEAQSRRFTTQAAALGVAARHGIAAPRLVAADLDGSATGQLAMLQTVLPGSSLIPRYASRSRLRGIGRATARIHAVQLEPSPALPVRSRSIGEVDFAALTVPGPSAALFAAARDFLARARPPARAASVLVHGDLWQGNMLFTGDHHSGTVDWDYAGTGPAGIDTGSLRCDIAVMYGPPAADEVLAGWEERHGPAADTSWWDLIAVTCSPPDMGLWLPNFHGQGRQDLDLATVTARRDAFLAAALRGLGAGHLLG